MNLIARAAALDATRNSALRTMALSQMPKLTLLDETTEFAVLHQGNNYMAAASMLSVLFSKEKLGLDKVDNTPDLDKPISRPTQTALDELLDRINQKASTAELDALEARVEVLEAKVPPLEDFMLNGVIPYTRVSGFDDRVRELIAEAPSQTITVFAGPNDW